MTKKAQTTTTSKAFRLVVPVEIPHEALTVVAAPPVLVTQANVEAVTGFTRGVYLAELLPAYEAAGGKVARVGKSRAVEREPFVAWLMSRTGATSRDTKPVNEDDALAAELGLRAAGGRR